MSKQRTSSTPAAPATNAAPQAPPAGPERTVSTAWRAARSSSISPPLDCMIAGSGKPVARQRSASARR